MKRFLLEYLPAWLLLTVLGFIVLHAPLTVWLGTIFPEQNLFIKAWKEVLIALATVPVIIQLWRSKKWRSFVGQPVVMLALVYIVLHIFMLGIYPQPLNNTVAGLMIDLRYVAYFLVVLGFLTLYPAYKKPMLRIGVAGAFIVVVFAVMQVFMPKYALEAIGYGDNTIQPYLTVDKNPDFIRHNSTLRGPNPLGAYAGMVLAGVAAYWLATRKKLDSWKKYLPLLVLGLSACVALWISYSRSAAIAAFVAILLVLAAKYGFRVSRRTWYIAAAVVVMAFGALYLARDTAFVHNVILHDNPTTGAEVTSNAAHAESFAFGMGRMLAQPLGAGIGSTGSASIIDSAEGLIIENQYLMIAHEVGWLGIIIFLMLFGALLRQLWIRRGDWLAAALFASGVGLAVIGILLPVWADDTVSLVWWGMAAVALIGGNHGQNTANKKAKRTT